MLTRPSRTLAVLVPVLAASLAGQTAPPSKVDWNGVARLVVSRNLALAPGERVLLFWDQASDRGAAAALRTAVAAAGGVISAEISAPTDADLAAIGRLSPDAQRIQRARRDSLWAAAFAAADVAIWLPTPMAGVRDRPFEHLVERSRVRSIHFHWFLPPDPADVDRVDAIYAAALATPPARLRDAILGIERAVKGAEVVITAPNGTNLKLTVAADAWIHRNDGDVSRAKVGPARTVRDREEELPASVFRTTDIGGAEGTIVGYATFDTRGPILKVTFAGNRVVRLESQRGADAIVSAWTAATGDKGIPGELVIGTNPDLPATLPSGFMPYYGYGAGVVRLAFGDNWESGGRNRSSNGETLLFIPNATVTANGRTVVRDGTLVER